MSDVDFDIKVENSHQKELFKIIWKNFLQLLQILLFIVLEIFWPKYDMSVSCPPSWIIVIFYPDMQWSL
jgi:hypothetical protein